MGVNNQPPAAGAKAKTYADLTCFIHEDLSRSKENQELV
jgi:hypothetical protein